MHAYLHVEPPKSFVVFGQVEYVALWFMATLINWIEYTWKDSERTNKFTNLAMVDS